MLTFVTLVGLGLAIIVFLNFLQTGSAPARVGPEKPPRVDPRRIKETRKKWDENPALPRPRICPLCGTMLEQHEYLLAAIEPEVMSNRKRQAQIYGCPYCITNDGVNKSLRRQLTELDV
ncbi:MAG: hypothetical protein HS115_16690 [Spirochaetales bacterium]|nr:hypothetical protein [Spirochaetales bacterium]